MTSILRKNEDYLNQMWNQMDEELRSEHRTEFEAVRNTCRDHFSHSEEPKRIERPYLSDAFK